MRKELDEKLCEKYPLIFRDRHANPRKTCMYWGFDCGDGWYNIIDALCHNIQERIDNRLAHSEPLRQKTTSKVPKVFSYS